MSRLNGYLAVKEKFDLQRQKLIEEAKQKYYLNPNICKQCNQIIPYEKRKTRLSFCSHSCSAKNSNVKRSKKNKLFCLSCKKQLIKKSNKYCNAKCQQNFIKKSLYEKLELGLTHNIATKRIRQYLIDKYGAKCMNCLWDKKNPITNNCPIELEHIDGNSENNNLNNLKLLCPNCHSLTPTYKALNKGNGRHSRKIRYNEGKSY